MIPARHRKLEFQQIIGSYQNMLPKRAVAQDMNCKQMLVINQTKAHVQGSAAYKF